MTQRPGSLRSPGAAVNRTGLCRKTPYLVAAMAKLTFYYASMNAGKTTTLLQADFNLVETLSAKHFTEAHGQ